MAMKNSMNARTTLAVALLAGAGLSGCAAVPNGTQDYGPQGYGAPGYAPGIPSEYGAWSVSPLSRHGGFGNGFGN